MTTKAYGVKHWQVQENWWMWHGTGPAVCVHSRDIVYFLECPLRCLWQCCCKLISSKQQVSDKPVETYFTGNALNGSLAPYEGILTLLNMPAVTINQLFWSSSSVYCTWLNISILSSHLLCFQSYLNPWNVILLAQAS